MIAAAVILLVGIVVACCAGIFAHSYRDNWGQFIGMVMLAAWSAGELLAVAEGEPVTTRKLLLYAALASFIGGTALKVMLHRDRMHRPGQVA